jgi:hypothetical protein
VLGGSKPLVILSLFASRYRFVLSFGNGELFFISPNAPISSKYHDKIPGQASMQIHPFLLSQLHGHLIPSISNIYLLRLDEMGLRVSDLPYILIIDCICINPHAILQVTGAWKVENENIIPLFQEVKRLEKLFDQFSIAHVRRVS